MVSFPILQSLLCESYSKTCTFLKFGNFLKILVLKRYRKACYWETQHIKLYRKKLFFKNGKFFEKFLKIFPGKVSRKFWYRKTGHMKLYRKVYREKKISSRRG